MVEPLFGLFSTYLVQPANHVHINDTHWVTRLWSRLTSWQYQWRYIHDVNGPHQPGSMSFVVLANCERVTRALPNDQKIMSIIFSALRAVYCQLENRKISCCGLLTLWSMAAPPLRRSFQWPCWCVVSSTTTTVHKMCCRPGLIWIEVKIENK